MPKARSSLVILGGLMSLAGLTACNSDGRTLRPARPDQDASVYTTTTSSTIVAPVAEGVPTVLDPLPTIVSSTQVAPTELAFVLNLPWEEAAAIDPRYTCDGADIQPSLSWLGAPADAVEMALVVVDTDADNFVHWVIAGLDPTNPFVGENDVPVSAIEGLNGFGAGDIGWRGPCPPANETHRYRFTLYALGEFVELPTGSSAADLQAVIDATSLAVAERTGTYTRT